jgi:hypothetical protein
VEKRKKKRGGGGSEIPLEKAPGEIAGGEIQQAAAVLGLPCLIYLGNRR